MPAPLDEVDGLLVVLALHLQRRGLPAAGQAHLAAARDVVADLADRPDRVLQGQVPHHGARLDHAQHQVGRADLQQHRRLGHVRVADDDVQPAVTLGVRVRLVTGVDDRPGTGGGRADALPDVLGALAHAVHRAPRRLQHLAGTTEQLPRDEERNEDVRQPGELPVPGHQIVLVTAVGVAGRVGVVLEEIDVARDSLLVQAAFGVDEQAFENALARLVVGDQLGHVVAFGSCVFRMRSHVEVETGAVPQEDIAAAAP